MKTKTQAKSRILEAVHGTAADLHSAGFISKRRMREYDALCLAPVATRVRRFALCANGTVSVKRYWRRF